MDASAPRPDLVIGIDFGMTCTGVAYCNVATGSENVRHIQKWPGRMQANENKVPTLLIYPPNSQTPSSWGFLAETAQEGNNSEHEIREWFKIMLDEHLLEKMQSKAEDPARLPTMKDVQKWYTDYFQLLYRTIEARLRGELASRWEDATIEFIFSVPTTWKPVPTVERFRNIILAAGFGSCPKHTATIGLTEAEAAAVHTARSMPGIFKNNEILFVCDVGGGTTDLSVFRIKDSAGGVLNLEQIDVVFGATIGAAQLDSLFENEVLRRLQICDDLEPMGLADINQAAFEMRISKEYQNAKCDYGSEESLADTETFAVRIPKLDRSYVNQEHDIEGGDMHFRRDDLKVFFDTQVVKLFDMMDKQLTRVREKFPGEQVAHLVLSGGLGHSAYIEKCLRSRYAFGNHLHPNAESMQIRIAPDPQMVVCKGNVADRVQKLKTGRSVLGWRCCRASYGTTCKVLYSPANPSHFGLRTEVDPFDKKTYVTNYIDWFVKQSEPVSNDAPIVKCFQRKCPPASPQNPNPTRIFPTEVISSDVEKSRLPLVKNNDCRSICKIESDFTSVPLSVFKLKNRHWWNRGPKYHRINYVVKVNMGPADISFELWHDGVKLSKDKPIKVEWQESAPPDPSLVAVAPDLPMSGLPAVGTGQQRRSKMNLNTDFHGTNGRWVEDKSGIRSQVVSQNGSTVW